MRHAFIDDTFWIRGRGLIAGFSYRDGFTLPEVGDIVTLRSPITTPIKSTVSHVELAYNNFDKPSYVAVVLTGFEERHDFTNWLITFQPDWRKRLTDVYISKEALEELKNWTA